MTALGLTPKESWVMDGVIRGLGNKEIAYELGLSVETVKNHITRILGGGSISASQIEQSGADQGSDGDGEPPLAVPPAGGDS